ncbi:hypothetical protein CALCODRAFT_482481 [Calocera cornea HHB12733]|uniref:Uncharacterized protein n=1 Tax=Calocera cornea HHB12733 TaxID=1353952 RepID=A0A165GRQ2_9BASI|nr:hypothetical protein CALCODRAFT_482481 [Calocera cornea HHB12733]
MIAKLPCGSSPTVTVVGNPIPNTYPYFAGAALYNETLGTGTPNWAVLTTSQAGLKYVANAWADATGVPPVSLRQGIFNAYGVGLANMTVGWQDGSGDTVHITAYGFARSDGNLVGITGDLTMFLATMAAQGENYTAVNFQIVGSS